MFMLQPPFRLATRRRDDAVGASLQPTARSHAGGHAGRRRLPGVQHRARAHAARDRPRIAPALWWPETRESRAPSKLISAEVPMLRISLHRMLLAAVVAGACVPVMASGQAQEQARPDDAKLIESAMSAAPAKVAANAKIVVADVKGGMRTLRDGGNGFTCMPDNPTTPGPD